jgi:hypothetical protein
MNTLENIGATSDGSVSSAAPRAGDRRKQDDAVAAIGREHQEDQRANNDQQIHGTTFLGDAFSLRETLQMLESYCGFREGYRRWPLYEEIEGGSPPHRDNTGHTASGDKCAHRDAPAFSDL